MRFVPGWCASVRSLVVLSAALAGCSSRSSVPAGDSDVDIQASTTATSDVKYIDIQVHQLSDGSLVYDSGLQPSSDFQDTRQHLEEVVALAGSTDFLFDATAYDASKAFLKAGNTVQEATQPPGTPTTILIVVDLNSGSTNPTSPADITAVTDNIPVLYPPTMTGGDGTFSLHYKATDADLDADAGTPVDSNETLTFFSTILAGNVDLSANSDPGLFTEGPDFTFTFNDTQPVKILSAVVDRLNQLTFAITIIDPVSGAFQTVEYGEGYALFDDNTIVPAPRKAHHRATDDPTGPPTGPIAVAVLKHGKQSPATAGGYSVEAISRTDDSLVVTPNNDAYWNDAVVASFNRYEEQPDALGDIAVDFKLRIAFPPPTAASVSDPNPNAPFIVDAIKMAADADGHFVFETESQEAAVLSLPSIDSVGGDPSPGGTVEVEGMYFTGAYDPTTTADPSQANDQRQIYLQQGSAYAYVANVMLDDDDDLSFDVPVDLAGGSWDLVVCSYGRLCVTQPGAIAVQSIEVGAVQPTDFSDGALQDINNLGIMVGYLSDNEGGSLGAVWGGPTATPIALASSDPDDYPITFASSLSNGYNDSTGYHYSIVGSQSDVNFNSVAVIWDETLTPTVLPGPPGAISTNAQTIERYVADGTEIIGNYNPSADGTAIGVAWIKDSSGSYQLHILAEPVVDEPGDTGSIFVAALGIANGTIVGYWRQGGTHEHAVVWPTADSDAVLLPDSGYAGSYAFKNLASGMVVGGVVEEVNGNQMSVAALWTFDSDTQTWSDPELLPSPAGIDTTSGLAINGQDQYGLGPTILGFEQDGGLPLVWTADGNGGWVVHVIPTVSQDGNGEINELNDFDVLVGFDQHDDTGIEILAIWTLGY